MMVGGEVYPEMQSTSPPCLKNIRLAWSCPLLLDAVGLAVCALLLVAGGTEGTNVVVAGVCGSKGACAVVEGPAGGGVGAEADDWGHGAATRGCR